MRIEVNPSPNDGAELLTEDGHVGAPTIRGRRAERTEEDVAALIAAQVCPDCGQGPFKVLAMHTRFAHGYGADELRRRAGLSEDVKVCAPEHSVALSELHVRNWQKPELRERYMETWTPERRRQKSETFRRYWSDPNARARASRR